MLTAGIDIGTSKICGMVIDDNAKPLKIIKYPNNAGLPGKTEKEQNPEIILEICKKLYREMKSAFPDISALGITGQMHGILYVDEVGNAVSSLYTWQDRKGMEIRDNDTSYADYLSNVTGHRCISGHGLVTHSYFLHKHVVPERAKKICTVSAYVAMHFAGRKSPILHKSDAESFDVFDLKNDRFDLNALAKAGISADVLPDIRSDESIIGKTEEGVSVLIPIGDNQASIIGSLCPENTPLINLGTGGQISMILPKSEISDYPGLSVRPFVDNKFLIVGITQCGGYAYALLERFFEKTAKMLGITPPDDLFERMEKEAAKTVTTNPIVAETTFLGTYDQPTKKASFSNITENNFTPGNITFATLNGMCFELFNIYSERILPYIKKKPEKIIGAGNCIRQTKLLENIIENTFKLPLTVNEQKEEAVYGASLLALSVERKENKTNEPR